MSGSLLYKLPPAEAEKVLALAVVSLRHKASRVSQPDAWHEAARAEQRPPEGSWRSWYIRGGRGGGKTWTGAHTLAEMARVDVGEWGAIGPTYADARDTCIEGPSGMLAALGTNRGEVDRGASTLVKSWNRSMGDLRMRNGSVVWADGADDGALRIQGKNLNGVWADEVGLWKQWKRAWEESIRYAVRIAPARIVATGTPKRGHALVRLLMDDPGVVKTLLRTMDNAEHLDPEVLAEWVRLYGGTTLGRQELGGEMLEDADGALWRREWIQRESYPIDARTMTPAMRRIVVAVDPAVTSDPSSDETGIVVCGLGIDGYGYALADVSLRGTPEQWARAAVRAHDEWKADRIIAEGNNGGDLVTHTIHTVDPNVVVEKVTASRGKQTRAEPISSLYQQGKVRHPVPLPELEDQLCNWDPILDAKSPDRLDALVWGMSKLMVASVWGGEQMSAVA